MKRSILDTIRTPLVQVESPPGSVIAAKLESANPGGSAKDRPALAMIEAAESTGALEPGDRVIEPTSGNTGIGLALVCATKGYDLTIVMPESKSIERRRLMRAYGADIELVDGEIQEAMERAAEIANETGGFRPDQFTNRANPDAHYHTTAEEIINDLDGRTVDAFVATIGTGGTITGTGKRLREAYPDIEIVGVEPAENAVISTGESGEDAFQGMGPGFVSDLTDVEMIDMMETVSIEQAEEECRRLAQTAGILVGQSSGAAMIAAQRVAERLAIPDRDCDPVATDGGLPPADCPLVVTLFPDSGERYISTGTFD